MKHKLLLLFTILSSYSYAQDYKSINYTNYQKANELFSVIDSLNYEQISTLKFEISGVYRNLGHYEIPKLRVDLPVKNDVIIIKDSCMFLSNHLKFGANTLLRQEFYSTDSCSILNYYSEKAEVKNAREKSYLFFYSPVSVFQDIERNKASLRYLGYDRNSNCDIISYTSSLNKQASVLFDRNERKIKSVQLLQYDNIQGDYLLEYNYLNYTLTDAGHYLPSNLVITEWGDTLQNLSYNYTQISMSSDRNIENGFTMQEIGKNTYKINYPTGKHFSYLIDFKSYLGIVEVSINEAYAQKMAQFIKLKFPNKEIKYAFLTHHHPDHAGGFSYFYKNGATVVTTELSCKFQKELLKRNHTLSEKKVSYSSNGEFFIIPSNSTKNFSNSSVKIIAYEFGDNDHTKEFLLYYLPDSQFLIIGDLYYSTPTGPKINSRADKLARFIEDNKLKVNKLYQTWSPIGANEYTSFGELIKAAEQYKMIQK